MGGTSCALLAWGNDYTTPSIGRAIYQRRWDKKWKTNKDLLTLNVSDAVTQMKLENIDYGTKTKKLHKKLLEGKRKEIIAAIRDSYVNMATDLQKCFSLDASLLMYLKCLDPANCRKTISVARIGHLGQLLPHVITEQEVTLVIETANSNCCRLSKSQIGGLRKKMENWNVLTCTGLWYSKCCWRKEVHTIVKSCEELSVIAKLKC